MSSTRDASMGDSGTNDKKVRGYKVTRPDYGETNCSYRDWETLRDAELSDADVGEKIFIELIEMPEDQWDNLPEFEGW